MTTNMPVISTLEDANTLLETLRTLTTSISEGASSPTLKTEQDYITTVVPQLDEATATYQSLATFLREHKRGKSESSSFRDVQRAFVRTMQDLQSAQRQAATRREALCDADFLAGNGSVAISAQEIQTAKEEVLEAGEIAQEAAAVNALFRQVGTLVHEQGQGVDQIATKVEAIRVEIGKGVDELQHARQLQREARQKYLWYLCILTLILAAIIIPLVFALK
ncbi:Snare domain containing protein [Phytophthora palmivora]|uniref:Snare domain containing protein n=1 Tax=Phytophthora palmivora TaxID=4796 RepID=A0A2P4XDK8_9STRA|nr:Snare domain containing protein [Phytophthora palmivora]